MDYRTINIIIDGWQIYYGDRQPIIVDGRVMVPVRTTFEALGFQVDWFPYENHILIHNHEYMVSLLINSYVFYINGIERFIEPPVQVVNNTSMMPLRIVLEELGFNIYWDAGTETAFIISAQEVQQAYIEQVIYYEDYEILTNVPAGIRVSDYWIIIIVLCVFCLLIYLRKRNKKQINLQIHQEGIIDKEESMTNEMKDLLTKANTGDMYAMNDLSLEYEKLGDVDETISWAEKALSNGHGGAGYRLAMHYYLGLSPNIDFRKIDSEKFFQTIKKTAFIDGSGFVGWAKVLLGVIYCNTVHSVWFNTFGENHFSKHMDFEAGAELINDGIYLIESKKSKHPLHPNDYMAAGEAYRECFKQNGNLEYLIKACYCFANQRLLLKSDDSELIDLIEKSLMNTTEEFLLRVKGKEDFDLLTKLT